MARAPSKTVFVDRAAAAKAEYRRLENQWRTAIQWRKAEGEDDPSVDEVLLRGRLKGLAHRYGSMR